MSRHIQVSNKNSLQNAIQNLYPDKLIEYANYSSIKYIIHDDLTIKELSHIHYIFFESKMYPLFVFTNKVIIPCITVIDGGMLSTTYLASSSLDFAVEDYIQYAEYEHEITTRFINNNDICFGILQFFDKTNSHINKIESNVRRTIFIDNKQSNIFKRLIYRLYLWSIK